MKHALALPCGLRQAGGLGWAGGAVSSGALHVTPCSWSPWSRGIGPSEVSPQAGRGSRACSEGSQSSGSHLCVGKSNTSAGWLPASAATSPGSAGCRFFRWDESDVRSQRLGPARCPPWRGAARFLGENKPSLLQGCQHRLPLLLRACRACRGPAPHQQGGASISAPTSEHRVDPFPAKGHTTLST